jgi:hypothetical protein
VTGQQTRTCLCQSPINLNAASLRTQHHPGPGAHCTERRGRLRRGRARALRVASCSLTERAPPRQHNRRTRLGPFSAVAQAPSPSEVHWGLFNSGGTVGLSQVTIQLQVQVKVPPTSAWHRPPGTGQLEGGGACRAKVHRNLKSQPPTGGGTSKAGWGLRARRGNLADSASGCRSAASVAASGR